MFLLHNFNVLLGPSSASPAGLKWDPKDQKYASLAGLLMKYTDH
jgi:hypothetical protein